MGTQALTLPSYIIFSSSAIFFNLKFPICHLILMVDEVILLTFIRINNRFKSTFGRWGLGEGRQRGGSGGHVQ